MLTVYSGRGSKDCAGQSRRDFLRVGALGLGSLTLPGLLAARAAAAKAGGYVNDKSVVLLFLGGGPSQIETFNPNVQAPEPYASIRKATAWGRSIPSTINKNGGRDHWPKLCTLALAGGGLKMGQVIGQSGKKNDSPATDPISTPNLMATVMHTLFDPSVLRLDPAVPRELAQLIERGEPIRALLG